VRVTLPPFRFGVLTSGIENRAAFVDTVRQVEELGYDTLLVPDADPVFSPFAALDAAAFVSSRIRLAPFVIDPARREISTLIEELATLDQLSDGRVDIGLGLGLGRMTAKMGNVAEDGTISAQLPGAARSQNQGRVARLRAVLAACAEAIAGERPDARFARERPPIMIGGSGDRLIEIAAESADILALSGPRTAPVYPALMSAADADERFTRFRTLTGERAGVSPRVSTCSASW
jgi:alkanesulfonate monooxygenase SsuD/methylene tetrahydromethanopterin reductase-like flavin-dependent oxidoreductase (luciferase family)